MLINRLAEIADEVRPSVVAVRAQRRINLADRNGERYPSFSERPPAGLSLEQIVPSVGSGMVIDAAGLRGWRQGSAHVSDKHANFIQADDGGAADDVWALMRMVRARVLEHSGFDLRSEIRLVGFGPDATESRG